MASKKRIPLSKKISLAGLVFLILGVGITVFFLQQQWDTRQRASQMAEFQLKPEPNIPKTGEPFLVAIAINSQNTPIQRVSLSMTYPENKFEIIEVDTSHTAFDIAEEQIVGNGLAKIGRESVIPRTGIQPIATVKFNVKENASTDEITILSNSTAQTTDNKNLVTSTTILTSDETQNNPVMGTVSNLSSANSSFWDWLFSYFSKR